MSGFERSAPIPGSQGPRRSQMVRFNKAPPPMTPWRAEVLEAQRQLQASSGKRSRSRSRSRSRARKARERDRERDGERERETGAAGSAGPAGRRGAAITPEAGAVLRQARERGEGWFAAVARAAESWDTVQGRAGKKAAVGQGVDEALQQQGKKQKKESRQKRPKDPVAPEAAADRGASPPAAASPEPRRENPGRLGRREDEERQRIEFEEKAEERRLRAEQDKRRIEEEKRRQESMKKERQQKLRGAFAVDGDDDDEDSLGPAARLLRRASREAEAGATPLGAAPPAPVARAPAAILAGGAVSSGAIVAASAASPTAGWVVGDISEKLHFEPGLSPAEAFMRLQERKRKGRRTEFGGPPRGCSPWRDGKRGVTFEKQGQ